jgi:hypothetical protein
MLCSQISTILVHRQPEDTGRMIPRTRCYICRRECSVTVPEHRNWRRTVFRASLRERIAEYLPSNQSHKDSTPARRDMHFHRAIYLNGFRNQLQRDAQCLGQRGRRITAGQHDSEGLKMPFRNDLDLSRRNKRAILKEKGGKPDLRSPPLVLA